MRKALPDLLKGIAVILMVQVHLMELFARQDIFDGIFGKLSLFLGGPPAAPVFMAVMGYFLAQGNKTLPTLLYRGCKLLIWGLFLNLGLNAHLLYHIIEGSITLNPLMYIFGVDILFLAGFSVLIIALLRPVFREKYIAWAILSMLVVMVSTFLPFSSDASSSLKYPLAYVAGHYSWSYFPLVPWLAYPLTGYTFALMEKQVLASRITPRYLLVSLIVTSLVLLYTLQQAVALTHDLQRYYHHGLLFFGWTLYFLVAWTILGYYITQRFSNNKVFRYICWTGKNVTAFYVFQWLIIGNIATQVYKTQGKTALSLWFAGIMILTSLLVLGWTKLKEFRKKDDLI